MSTWVVVADAGRARIFSAGERTGPLSEVEDLVHTETRLHDMELDSDKPGRSFDSHGEGRHALGTHNDPREQEHRKFAKQVSDRLAAARKGGRFERLYIVATPRFLGLLREALDAPTRKTVAGEVHKDLTVLGAADVRSHLPERL